MLNNDLMAVYPAMWVESPPTSDIEWSVARYLDGRPAGGVLVSNGLWWRYETSLNNLRDEPESSNLFSSVATI